MSLTHAALMLPASIPSPSEGVWHLGPLPLRGYALCIVLGIIAAVWIGDRRWLKRGGRPGEVIDVAVWAVLFGIVGARIYHVATDYDLYFGEGRNPVDALKIWNGGLGIWGGVALGAVGVWLCCRTKGIKVLPMLDALAPGVLVAQAIGRWGNWFNQELFGGPTDKPWGLEIDVAHRPLGYEQFSTFHPTFLYECLWNLAAFLVLIALDRKYRIGHGRMVALYVMAYTLGRAWNENMRTDPVQMNDILGLRLNVWTSIILFVAALVYFLISQRRHPGQETEVYLPGRGPDAEPAVAKPTAAEPAAAEQQPAASPVADERKETDTPPGKSTPAAPES